MTTLLILAVVVLGLLVAFRLSRVAELTAALRGQRQEDIPERDNRLTGRMMWAFLVAYLCFFIWLPIHFRGVFLPPPASTQGVWIDAMFHANWYLLGVVFFGTNVALFYFAGRYYHRPGTKAFWMPHNNKIELLWTVIPAVVLVGVIIYGLTVWNKITAAPAPGTAQIELYAKQFDWTVRYPGKDGKLGATDFRLIDGDNPLGIVTRASIAKRLAELHDDEQSSTAEREAQADILPKDGLADMDDHIAHVRRMIERIMNLRTLMEQDIAANGDNSTYLHGSDDNVVKEFHLPVDQGIDIRIRSQDVIHSAYLPHMRAQMNAVPGMTTHMHFVPTITTDSMRLITGNPDFDYILLCNKVCGISHYNMQMPLTIEKEDAYQTWAAKLKPFEGGGAGADSVKTQVAGEAKAAEGKNKQPN